jgi:hypothetical protein
VLRQRLRRVATPVTRRLSASLALAVPVVLGAAGACSSPSTPSSSPSTPSPSTLTLDEHARSTTVTLRTGTSVVVRLHSTYWSTPVSSDPHVLRPAGGGSSPTASCPPGGGCGVSSAHFIAAHPGTTRVTAHRSSCGEAMRCPPGAGAYEVTVTVKGP